MKSPKRKSGILLNQPWFFILLCVSFGALLGLGGFIFIYAKGYSYLSSDPKACANCHVMQEHYESWTKSSHHFAASCNDCHVPHTFPEKYFVKAKNGYNHSKAFTLQDFPQPIRITDSNLKDLQHNCIHCHSTLVSNIAGHRDVVQGEARCTQCHRSTGHMSLD